MTTMWPVRAALQEGADDFDAGKRRRARDDGFAKSPDGRGLLRRPLGDPTASRGLWDRLQEMLQREPRLGEPAALCEPWEDCLGSLLGENTSQ